MFVFMIFLGVLIKGRPAGILINERNLISLSRFQTVLWTLIILSAFFTMALQRIRACTIPDPLGMSMDWQLWALMGISVTSLVGTPLIQSNKKKKEPKNGVTEKAAEAFKALGEDEASVNKNREGILYGNADFLDARLTDMFEGDELGNTPYVDLSKVQMFFFTVVASLTYTVLLFKIIINTNTMNLDQLGFPALPEGLIALLGISHAGYLSSKEIDHTKLG